MNQQPDVIHIADLEISARVGVPDEERVTAQRLTVSVTLQPRQALADVGDDLRRTIDYAAVCDELQDCAGRRTDRLIETLADAMARHLLARFPLLGVELELRKFILPHTRYVAVRIVRRAPSAVEN